MIASLPDVYRFEVVAGSRATPDGIALLIEVPHGATATAQFRSLERRMASPLPPDLVDFFHVNTDAGAPELAQAIAQRLVGARPELSVAVLTSEIPRTFVDCNRVLDASPEAYKEGRVTPGVPPWITAPEDHALLRANHARYIEAVDQAMSLVCGSGGKALLLHSYAPRSVDVEVDRDIGANMRRAYAKDRVEQWPLRPSIDVIGRTHEGELQVDQGLVDLIVARMGELGLDVALSGTYPLHPTTHAWRHAHAWPGQVACVEVRRDLLADPFEPFAQMTIGEGKVEAIAGVLGGVLATWIARGTGA